MEWIIAALIILLLLCGSFIAYLWFGRWKSINDALDAQKIALQEDFSKREEYIKRNTRNKLMGTIFETFGIILPEFPYNPNDVFLLSNAPSDFVVFDGLEESDGTYCKSVDFVDFKAGRLDLNSRERSVKNCVCEGRVTYKIIGYDKKEVATGKITVKNTIASTVRTPKSTEPVIYDVSDEEFEEIMSHNDEHFGEHIKLSLWNKFCGKVWQLFHRANG